MRNLRSSTGALQRCIYAQEGPHLPSLLVRQRLFFLPNPTPPLTLTGKSYLTRFSQGIWRRQFLSENPNFSHVNLLLKRSLHQSKCLSAVAVTTAVEHKAEGLSQASPAPVATSAKAITSSLRHYGRCYWELSKARLSMLVVTTAGAGYVMGSGLVVDYYGLSWTCMGTFCVAAAANTINQILEVENDSQMKRTSRRPLPTGRVTIEHAMAWAAITGTSGIALLASQANAVAAGLGAINLVLYTLVYTPLKQMHPVNTWVGAFVGAVPPLLGWAAAAGEVSTGAWILASALFFWQIPHFMAIAYMCRQDYAAGGFKMLSMQDVSGRRTALVALRNCAYLAPLGFLSNSCGITTGWFGVETALLSAGMGATAALFYLKPSTEGAKNLFRASLLYLPFLLTAMLVHRQPSKHVDGVFDENLLEEGGLEHGLVDEDTAEECKHVDPKKGSRPPVAFFSVAPFPFLPVPDFGGSSS